LVLAVLTPSACKKRTDESVVKPSEDSQPDRTAVGQTPAVKGPSDAARLEIAVSKVKAGETNVIDARRFPKIGDGDLHLLKGLTTLRDLNLDTTAVTNKGMKEIAALPGLKVLSLTGTPVTDEG